MPAHGIIRTIDHSINHGVSRGAVAESPEPTPVFQALGAPDVDTVLITPAWPTHEVGDIGLLFVTVAGNQVVTLSDAQGFTEITTAVSGADVTLSCRLSVFWCRATSTTMAAPTVADTGSYQIGQIITFRGCIASGDPVDVFEEGIAASGTAVSIPGAITTKQNTLVVVAVANATDTATDQTSGFTNAALTSIAELEDTNSTVGTGGGFGVAAGEKVAAGDYGTTTATLATASEQAFVSLALKSY